MATCMGGDSVSVTSGDTSDVTASTPKPTPATTLQSCDMLCESETDSPLVCKYDDLVSLNQELDKLLDPMNSLGTPPASIFISPLECVQLQQEEFEILSSIYGKDMRPLNDTHSCFVVHVSFLTEEIKKEDVIKIWFSLPPNYPSVPPVFELESCPSGVCSYKDADELYDIITAECFKRTGHVMIFDLVTIAQEFMAALVEKKKLLAEEREAADLKRKNEMEIEDAMKKSQTVTGASVSDAQLSETPSKDNIPEDTAPDESESESTPAISYKIDAILSSGAVLKPTQFIGRISEILDKLPADLQISRIENVLRQDLAHIFCSTMKRMTSSLWRKERRSPYVYNLKPQIAFHGTVTTNLPSIVQRGLVIPGMGNEVHVRSGSSLGLGIYLSPNPNFSLRYATSNRLIVCATLLGLMYRDGNIKKSSEPHSNYYSVISSCEQEWVLFNAGQVLPCYVIQVFKKDDKNPEPPPLANALLKNSASDDTEPNTQKKMSLLARARKFLPYGFGPGSKTVIEDAASFDDDEEDYGDYQESRNVREGDEVFQETFDLQTYRYKN